MGHDPDSSKIKAVGIPASLDGHVRMISFVGVAFAGTVQQSEVVIVQIKHCSTKLGSKLSSPWPVLRIGDFVDPP